MPCSMKLQARDRATAHFLPSRFAVTIERRDYDRRSSAQRRVVECLRVSSAGSTPAEVAEAADIPSPAAGRIIRKLAAKWLVRRNELSRWAAAELLLHVPRMIRVS